MARPRRLRHKLMLGLGLVVGSVALLLGGTLYGLDAYLTTVRLTDRKLYELQQLNVLLHALADPPAAPGPDVNENNRRMADQDGWAVAFAAEYRKQLGLTVDAGLDPEGGEMEYRHLDRLDVALRRAVTARERFILVARDEKKDEAPVSNLTEVPEIKLARDEARRFGNELRAAVADDIGDGIRHSNKAIRQSLWVVGLSTAQLVLTVVALLVYFRDWIYAPIRELQSGVQRVHAGDFDHPVKLSSGDELQELGDAMNAMAARVGADQRDLTRQVTERSRQLVRSERMVSVGFLAAGVAHEINNPLASILFCAEALERRVADADPRGRPDPDAPAVVARYLSMIQQEALRCKDITQKLLDFSRSGDRKREPTDLAGLVRGVLEVARHLPNGRGRNVAFTPTGYVVAPVNAQDLKSVILNLVVNALDSMDEGGTLTITLTATPDAAELAFADTGCGMTPDVLDNIFEPFFTRSRTGKGTGLGLFISHQIVDQHGGQIAAASPGPGRGSTFTVRLPLREVVPAAADADPAAVLPFPGKMAA